MDDDGDRRIVEGLLPSPDSGPDALFARRVLLAEIEAALGGLREPARNLSGARNREPQFFAEISAETGVGFNTLLSRKHYVVKRLRSRLRRIYDESGFERRSK